MYTINDANASDIALRLFRFQAEHNPVYRKYLTYLKVDVAAISALHQIPFLPVSFFKNHLIQTGSWTPEQEFTSSGTTGQVSSRHLIAETDLYLAHAERCFEHAFGPLSQYHIFALMPSYLERKGSSLVAMLESFIKKTGSAYSGFYLYEQEKLLKDIAAVKDDGRTTIIWGVSFALLDLAEKFSPDLSHCIVIETGGMKGRRKEVTRQELHRDLRKHFNLDYIYSEYGMTELLSQGYTRGGELFYPSPWIKIIAREIGDPFERGLIGRSAGLNVIDFANIHSIAFIETEDSGKVHADGSFEVAGRLDNSDSRGCNLMVD